MDADEGAAVAPVAQLGTRLREARLRSGLSLREVARQLGVSPSFVSQLENGKSQPSVATLYSVSQLLDVSIDVLFEPEKDAATEEPVDPGADGGTPAVALAPDDEAAGRPSIVSQLAARARSSNRAVPGHEAGGWHNRGPVARSSFTSPGERARLVMDSGVIWEQLARNTDDHLDFIEITYPAGSSSTTDERMLRHQGFEYGYLLEGELQVTVGFDAYVLKAGQALGLDSSVPHLFRNLGDVPARGIWFVHHSHD